MVTNRTPLLLVTGVHRSLAAAAPDALLPARPGTVVVHPDVRGLGQGVAVRTMREHGPDGVVVHRSVIELAHGCLSCTAPTERTATGERPPTPRLPLAAVPDTPTAASPVRRGSGADRWPCRGAGRPREAADGGLLR